MIEAVNGGNDPLKQIRPIGEFDQGVFEFQPENGAAIKKQFHI